MHKKDAYYAWLARKKAEVHYFGFDVQASEIHPYLKPFQRDIVLWAIKGGRRAVFAAFGLGKTVMQCEILRQLHRIEGGKYLIVCPLGVKQEFQQDAGVQLGMDIQYVRTDTEVAACTSDFMITNYERVRDGNITPQQFTGVTLDEASVLRSYGSKTFQEFLPLFADVRFRFVATATPSPNKFKELIHYSGYLGIMDTGQALTRFFKRDSQKANKLTLYEHKETEFWLWMSTWACFIQKPSDLGYGDEGYELPKMQLIEHRLELHNRPVRADSWGQYILIPSAAVSLRDAATEKRESIPHRLAKLQEILASEQPETHWLLWHHLEAERKAISRTIPDAKIAYGSQEIEIREKIIMDFSAGRCRILATKPRIAGSGCNFQKHCNNMIFMGIDYKFNDFIQSIHRLYRFLQQHKVNVHVIYTDAEDEIWKVMRRKWKQHEKMMARMQAIIRKFGLTRQAITDGLERTMGTTRREVKGNRFVAVANDCIDETMQMPDSYVDLIHTSIPFGNHYEYSASYNDFGHNKGDREFFEQMDFLIPELLRVLKPGRVAAIHVKDRILYGNVTGLGFPTVGPFSDKTREAFCRHGFHFVGRITIVTDVVAENNQTYRLGYSEMCKDSSKMGCGMSEYLLLFRKQPSDLSNGYADMPIEKNKADYSLSRWQIDAHGFWRSNGNRMLLPEQIDEWTHPKIIAWWRRVNSSQVYDHDAHVKIGEILDMKGRLPRQYMLLAPVATNDTAWTDITRMRTLNGSQAAKKVQMHICPLQFDVVDRVIDRYSNPGELVFDPFGGLMTVPYRAILKGRKGYGVELNDEYWADGVGYCKAAEHKLSIPTLFDHLETEESEEK